MRFIFPFLIAVLLLQCTDEEIKSKPDEKTREIAEKESPLELTENELSRFFGIVHISKYNYKTPDKPLVLSKNFEKVLFAPLDDRQIKYKYFNDACENLSKNTSHEDAVWENIYQYDSEIRFPDTNKRLLTFYGCGFEVIPYIFGVFGKTDTTYTFHHFINRYMLSGIGYVKVFEIHTIDENTYLLIGENKGGDAGEEWGSFWLGYLTNEKYLEIAYEKNYEFDYQANELKYEYVFDKNNHEIILHFYERIAKEKSMSSISYGEWQITSLDTISIK